MNNIFKTICLVLTGAALASCTLDFPKESEYPFLSGNTGQTPEITFSGQKDIAVGKTGGEFKGSFKSNLPWVAESLVDWIEITSDKRGMGGNGETELTFNVTRNTTLRSRTGQIRVSITSDAEACIKVVQEPSLPEDLGNEWFIKPGATGKGTSWEDATDLGEALKACATADKLYLAAGTYTPTQYAGGSSDADKTFLLTQNVRIYGGYPANPKAGDAADPAVNKTILSGNESSTRHVFVIAAPKDDDYSIQINGITVRGGCNTSTSAGTNKLNGEYFFTGYGAGVYVLGSKVKFTNCFIKDNKSAKFACGMFSTNNSYVEMEHCEITDNMVESGNAAGIHNAGTMILRNCGIRRNGCTKSSLVGGFYNYDTDKKLNTAKAYLYSCEFENNSGSTNWKRVSNFYGRENSFSVIVNTTFYGTDAGNAPIAIYGEGVTDTEAYIISCTVAGNISSSPDVCSGIAQASSKVKVYNSIVSGNKGGRDGIWAVKSSMNELIDQRTETVSYSINAEKVFGDDVVMSGLLFDPEKMLGKASNGVVPLIGSGNPALTNGMTADQLKSIKSGREPEIDETEVVKDQKGNPRTGKVMGAYVGE
jgi:hypothetical protein